MRPLIGLVLETFPNASENFILNEILELERQGLDLHIFSLRPPSEETTHPNVAKVKATVTYVPSVLPTFDTSAERELVGAQVALFEQDSNTYLETLKLYLKRDENEQLNEFLQAGYLAYKLKKLGISHLHAHCAGVPAATAEIVQAFSGVSYSIAAHTNDIYLSNRAALNRRMAKADFIFTCSEYNRAHLKQISTSPTPIHIAYHGVDIARFSPKPKSQLSQVPLILSVGHLCEDNGFFYLLQACHLLKQTGAPFHCTIVGDGTLDDAIRQQITALDLTEQITLLGQVSQDELLEYYQQADLFVLPYLVTDNSNHENFPNVLLEAMVMEIPVISTSILGISELMKSYYNGILVPEKDVQSLAKALEVIIRQPEFRESLGKAARLTVLDKFGLKNNVSTIKDIFLKAVTQPIRLHTQTEVLIDVFKLAAS